MAERIPLKNPRQGFQPGMKKVGGRTKGVVNKTTRLLREAIIMAAEATGEDLHGKGQLVGYLTRIAKKNPELFCVLLGRVLPMQLVGPSESQPVHVHLTLPQMQERLSERGIPHAYDEPLVIEHQPRKTNGHSTNGHAS